MGKLELTEKIDEVIELASALCIPRSLTDCVKDCEREPQILTVLYQIATQNIAVAEKFGYEQLQATARELLYAVSALQMVVRANPKPDVPGALGATGATGCTGPTGAVGYTISTPVAVSTTGAAAYYTTVTISSG